MIRICWQCPKQATNPETAPIGICDECFDSLNKSIEDAANRPGHPPESIIFYNPKTVKAWTKIMNDVDKIRKNKKD